MRVAQQKESFATTTTSSRGVANGCDISGTGDAELHVGHYEYHLRPSCNHKAKSKKRTSSFRKRISSVFRNKRQSTSLSGHCHSTDTHNALTKATTRSSCGGSSESLDDSDHASEPVIPKLLRSIQPKSKDISYNYHHYHKSLSENDSSASIVMVIAFILQILFLCLRQSQFQFHGEAAKKKDPKQDEDVYEPVPHILSNEVNGTLASSVDSRARIGIPKEISLHNHHEEEELASKATSPEEVQLQGQRQTTLVNAVLSLKLVDASIEQRHEKQLVEKYRQMLLTLEQKHRQKQQSLEQHIHDLEEQVQMHDDQTKGPAAPVRTDEEAKSMEDDMEDLPSFQMDDIDNDEQAGQIDIHRAKPRRWRAYIFYPIEVQRAVKVLCPIPSSSSTTAAAALPTQRHYSMASFIIEENQFFPAMLAAIAKP